MAADTSLATFRIADAFRKLVERASVAAGSSVRAGKSTGKRGRFEADAPRQE